jgi:hypothetical protein
MNEKILFNIKIILLLAGILIALLFVFSSWGVISEAISNRLPPVFHAFHGTGSPLLPMWAGENQKEIIFGPGDPLLG